jgi:DNA repair exonuclease SbcCD ATPase subunit
MTEQKAREYYVEDVNGNIGLTWRVEHLRNRDAKSISKMVHVVEYSALQAANDRYRDMMLKWSEESLKNSERIRELELEKENIRTHLLSECKNHQETFDQINVLTAKIAELDAELEKSHLFSARVVVPKLEAKIAELEATCSRLSSGQCVVENGMAASRDGVYCRLEADLARLPIMPEKHRALEIRVKELEKVEELYHFVFNRCSQLADKLERAKSALKWYAKIENYDKVVTIDSNVMSLVCVDYFKPARECLTDLEREE